MLDGLKILLAEDNLTNQMVAVQMLESLGASVVLAVDGAEALEKIMAEPFDLALIDIEMPKISGIDLIKQLRDDTGPVATMPLIALTAYVMREHRAAIDKAGADGVIAKPILSIEQFGEDILKYCRLSQSVRRPEPDQEREVAAVAPVVADVPSGLPNGAEIDFDTFDRLFASFEGKAKDELATTIATDISAAADQIDASFRSSNLEGLRAATHVLISVSGAIGATKLQNLARCLNSAGHVPDYQEIEANAPLLIGEAERVVSYVGSAIGDR